MRFIENIEKEGSLVSYFLKETFIWKYYGVMMLLVVLSVIANLSFSYGFSEILSGNRQAAESISLIFLVFAGGKLSYTVCRFAYSQITLQLKMELKKRYSEKITGNLLVADYAWTVEQRGGDLIGKSCEDVDCTAEAMAVYLPKLFKSAGLLAFNAIYLSGYHLILGAAFVLPLPFLFFSEWKGREITRQYLRNSTAVLSERNAVFQDLVSHHDLITHTSAQEKMLSRMEEVNERYAKTFGRTMGALVGWMSPAILLNKVPLLLIGIWGSVLVGQDRISAAAFLSAFQFTYAFNGELADLDDFMANFPTLEVFMERVKELIDCPRQKSGRLETFYEYHPVIYFEKVSFCYRDFIVFEQLSFQVKAGEKVLLLGKNGSGKTTVLKLICGMYQPSAGRVRVYGEAPETYSLTGMRQILSYVSAEPVLWEGTLRDNLTCGKVIEEEKIIEALCAFDFYSAFPDRRVQDILEYLVKDNGENLSGGQRERIGLARAWLSGTPVILLDEATNSLDQSGEKKIVQFLCGSGRTVCMTTHHTELLPYFDRGIQLGDQREVAWKEKNYEKNS